jgi:tRNA1Val (adenine37-N6)-methyltransferase
MGFKFKQFAIEDCACAMKVGTDSIMLGSWIRTKNAQNILDIGTGCGLLSIMLAQKAPETCLIEGIDIDANAITQAKNNANKCPWPERLTFQHISLQQFPIVKVYDLIVCNPPYFPINTHANKTHSLISRKSARQTIDLDHPTLIKELIKHLSESGRFCCVLPVDAAKAFIPSAQKIGLYCTRQLQVQPKHQSSVTRLLLEFNRIDNIKISEKLSIYNELGQYSDEYKALCKDYYLNF